MANLKTKIGAPISKQEIRSHVQRKHLFIQNLIYNEKQIFSRSSHVKSGYGNSYCGQCTVSAITIIPNQPEDSSISFFKY